MFKRKELLVFAVLALALIVLYPVVGTSKGSPGFRKDWPGIPSPGHPFWWAQIGYTKPHNIPWDDADFAKLAKSGMNGVEINMDWGAIEPQKGHYNFQLLDRYMAEAAKSHLKIYLLFWESLGQGNPPPWLTARDVSSDGVKALEPPWWGTASRKAYFDYVGRTIDNVKTSPGFGGVYAAYGWLDSEWGPTPKGSHGVTGYAPADIRAFYRWLPRKYKTLAKFNRRWHTSYRAWSDVPVGRPGDAWFALYQRFRQYSAEEGFGAVSAVVRAHTNATLLYSWGGGICANIGPEVQGNGPDMFFRLARKYHAIVNLDDSNTTGLALLFGTMGRDYGVPLLNEWTPWHKDLQPEVPEWLGHIGLDAPYEVGEDFFIYPPPPQRSGFVDGWNAYREWHPILTKVIQGVTPSQPVAVIVPLHKISVSTNLNDFPNLTQELGDFWRQYHLMPHFVSDGEVARGIVHLGQFRAVVDLGNEVNTLPPLRAYARKHPVLKTLAQLASYAHPYVTMEPRYNLLEVVPTVEGSKVWLTLANRSMEPYAGTVRFDPGAFGLHSTASFNLESAKTGQSIPATRSADGDIQWRVDMPRAGFEVLQLNLSKSAAK